MINNTKAEPIHYADKTATYSFEATVIDLRTDQRQRVTVDANTKAAAGKWLRIMGYKVQDMGFI